MSCSCLYEILPPPISFSLLPYLYFSVSPVTPFSRDFFFKFPFFWAYFPPLRPSVSQQTSSPFNAQSSSFLSPLFPFSRWSQITGERWSGCSFFFYLSPTLFASFPLFSYFFLIFFSWVVCGESYRIMCEARHSQLPPPLLNLFTVNPILLFCATSDR